MAFPSRMKFERDSRGAVGAARLGCAAEDHHLVAETLERFTHGEGKRLDAADFGVPGRSKVALG